MPKNTEKKKAVMKSKTTNCGQSEWLDRGTVARVDTMHPEVADTIDYPPAKTQFTFAEGRCIELLYVGRSYMYHSGDEAYLRINSSEDEKKARQEMELRAQMQTLAHEVENKGNH
jgi:hypothetical protein